jgi:hypothetical protein
MLTKTFTIKRHIEALRAGLRTLTDTEERREIQAEPAATLQLAGDLDRTRKAMISEIWRERYTSLSLHSVFVIPRCDDD